MEFAVVQLNTTNVRFVADQEKSQITAELVAVIVKEIAKAAAVVDNLAVTGFAAVAK
jgi:hypothetical protein